jgi:hypothetical protein
MFQRKVDRNRRNSRPLPDISNFLNPPSHYQLHNTLKHLSAACEQSIHSNPKLRNRNDKDTHACLPLEELVAAAIYLKLFSVFGVEV